MADAGLGGQMDDGVEAIGGKQFAKRRAIGDVALLEVEIRVSGEFGQAGFLQLRVIVGIEIVERDDGAAVGEQTPRDVKADEAGRPSDQNRLHRAAFLPPLSPDSEASPKHVQSSRVAPTI